MPDLPVLAAAGGFEFDFPFELGCGLEADPASEGCGVDLRRGEGGGEGWV